MILYSFGFAAFIFHALPPDVAGPVIRRAFPYFYLFVIACSIFSSILISPFDKTNAALLALIAITTLPVRQILMPAINRAADDGNRTSFKFLHSLSVVVTMGHIFICAWVLVRFLRA